MLAIAGARILAPEPLTERGTILIRDGRIEALLPEADTPIPDGYARLDAEGLVAVPGLIDLQLNGGFGRDFTDDPSAIWDVASRLPQFGVTTFLPTIITAPLGVSAAAQDVLAAGPPPGWVGARPLGLHIEGPFLNPGKKGAHNPAYLQPPSPQAVAGWSPATGVRLVTLAPELPGAAATIARLVAQDVVVSAGHSLATYDEARAGFDAGIRYATHLFNAMPPLHHREPGLVAAALGDDRVTIGLMSDGFHVHPAMVDLVWRLVGPERLTVVTDAMAALGMPPGDYLLGDHGVIVTEEGARLGDGTLAGCILSLDAVLRNFMSTTGGTLAEALPTMTTTPAWLLGLVGELGTLREGAAADVVLMTPDGHVRHTFIGGRPVFRAFG